MSNNHRNRLSKMNGNSPKSASANPHTEETNDAIKGELMANLGSPAPVVAGQKIAESQGTPPTGRRRGRPIVMDEELKSKVCLLLSVGLSRRQAAAYLSIVHTTIASAIERDENFAADVQRAEQLSVIKPMLVIANASQKNWRAAVWLLKRNERRLPKSDEERQEALDEAKREGRQIGQELAATLAGMDANKRA